MDNKKDNLTLKGAVALGTGVMIVAGIFALLGQVAALSGTWFPFIFIVAAIISSFSTYLYIKVFKELNNYISQNLIKSTNELTANSVL